MERWADERKKRIRTIVKGTLMRGRGRRRKELRREVIGIKREKGRRSKDKKFDKKGRILVKVVEEKGWEIFNGNIRGDKKGECTYTGAI